MKKMLQKMASALFVVVIAGSCAFAQGQSNAYQSDKVTNIREAAVKKEAEPVKVQDSERDIYRATKSTTVTTQKVKTVKDVKRTVSGTNEAEKAAGTYPKATRINIEDAKKNPAPKAKTRVDNTSKALPANYKKASELKSKPTENK